MMRKKRLPSCLANGRQRACHKDLNVPRRPEYTARSMRIVLYPDCISLMRFILMKFARTSRARCNRVLKLRALACTFSCTFSPQSITCLRKWRAIGGS